VAAGPAFILAGIARNKGYSFDLWWLYGWLLWIVALIHSMVLPDKHAPQAYTHTTLPAPFQPAFPPGQSLADELKNAKICLIRAPSVSGNLAK
jgi:hypothetical protein